MMVYKQQKETQQRQEGQPGLCKFGSDPAYWHPGSWGPVSRKVGLSPPSPSMYIIPDNISDMGPNICNILFVIDRADVVVVLLTLSTLTFIHDVLKQTGHIMEVSHATRTGRGEFGNNPKNMPIILVNNPPM